MLKMKFGRAALTLLLLALTACQSVAATLTAAPASPSASEAATQPAALVTPAPAEQTSAVAPTDLSKLTYTQAFDQMFEAVRREYAFNGVPGKQPNWSAVAAAIRPEVEQAEKAASAEQFFLALRDFTLQFNDGQVNVGGGEMQVNLFQAAIQGGYGLALRELDDGRVLVTYLTAGGPAERAGIQRGAQVTAWNDQPIPAAIDAATLWGAPPSQPRDVRYQKLRYLTRAKLGAQTKVTFVNAGVQPQTVTLTAAEERQSFAASSIFLGYDPNAAPVEWKVLPSGFGYIKITSTADDRARIISLYERALQELSAANVPGMIIDLRIVVNVSADAALSPLGLAGYLTNQKIALGQLQYYNPASGIFENAGEPLGIQPAAQQFHFDKLALLVSPACSNACELEAYGFSQLPGAIVIGQSSTAGTLSDVRRGQFLLPAGFSLQIPTGRFVSADGSVFLEGHGVQPTLRVPVDESTALLNSDVVLSVAEQALLK